MLIYIVCILNISLQKLVNTASKSASKQSEGKKLTRRQLEILEHAKKEIDPVATPKLEKNKFTLRNQKSDGIIITNGTGIKRGKEKTKADVEDDVSGPTKVKRRKDSSAKPKLTHSRITRSHCFSDK